MFGDAWECTYDGELKLQPVRVCVSYIRIHARNGWAGRFPDQLSWRLADFACLTPSPRFPLHVHRQEEVESVHPMTLEEVFQRVEVRFGSNRSIHPLLGQ